MKRGRVEEKAAIELDERSFHSRVKNVAKKIKLIKGDDLDAALMVIAMALPSQTI
jgi:hypothetical protein